MASIAIQKQLNMTDAEALIKVEQVADKLAEEYGLTVNWLDNYASIRGAGVEGSLQVSDGTLDLRLQLGFLAAAFKPKIERAINDYFDKLA